MPSSAPYPQTPSAYVHTLLCAIVCTTWNGRQNFSPVRFVCDSKIVLFRLMQGQWSSWLWCTCDCHVEDSGSKCGMATRWQQPSWLICHGVWHLVPSRPLPTTCSSISSQTTCRIPAMAVSLHGLSREVMTSHILWYCSMFHVLAT